MIEQNAYIQVEKLNQDKSDTDFMVAFSWNSDSLTEDAYNKAKNQFQVNFNDADYLIDLFEEEGEMKDTFPIAELGYRTLVKQEKAPKLTQ